jgi:hypothetical protein
VDNAGASGDVLVEARVLGEDMQLAYLQHLAAESAFPM